MTDHLQLRVPQDLLESAHCPMPTGSAAVGRELCPLLTQWSGLCLARYGILLVPAFWREGQRVIAAIRDLSNGRLWQLQGY